MVSGRSPLVQACLGMPSAQAGTARAMGARRGRSTLRLLVVLVTVALVLVPVGLAELPREIGRWWAASASESALNDDYASAIRKMDRAIAWNGDDAALYLQRAEYRTYTKEWADGLEDCDQARQLVPDAPSIGMTRSRFLQHLGRHEAAIKELKQLVRAASNPGERAIVLNALAYARAVGNRELLEGLEAVDASLEILGSRPAMLNPTGYLHYARGYTAAGHHDLPQALESLTQARQHTEAKYRRALIQLQAIEDIAHGVEQYAERVRVLKSQLAGILALRAEILEDVDRPEEAEADRKQIESLAPSGNIAVVEPIPLSVALERVDLSGQILDTRGYLYYRLDDLAAAGRDMQSAVEAVEQAYAAMPWIIEAEKHSVSDLRPLQQQYRHMKNSLAVVHYHRMLVNEARGRDAQAAEDRARVIELGCEPNDQLF